MVTFQLHVTFWKTEKLKSGYGELKLGLDVALQLDIVDLVLKEVFARLLEFEIRQPLVEVLLDYEVLCVSFRFLLKLLRGICSLFLLLK